MEKELILGCGWGIYKVNLEHLVVPESRQVLKRKKSPNDGVCPKDTGTNLKEFPVNNAEPNMLALD